ncbi:Zinc finger protein 26 [Papilio machaon]|uniref:Zinc finger protein 26 n=1 Tax=Papilio machaon TaxID=76193 RepID=A0A0N0PD27_PAPMA|nr:Zinc finger protein 26 [Papilio machaon]
MDFKTDIIIKEEPIDFEEEEIKLIDYNVSVKIENCATPDEIWCARNEALFAEIEKKLNEAEKNNQCRICGQRFVERHKKYLHDGVKAAWRHRTSLNPNEEIPCKECDKIFTNRNSLKTHMRNCHSTPHQCYICKSILKSKSYLMTHMLRVHDNSGNVHECEICGKKFKSLRYVRIHIKNSHMKSKKTKVIKQERDSSDEEI